MQSGEASMRSGSGWEATPIGVPQWSRSFLTKTELLARRTIAQKLQPQLASHPHIREILYFVPMQIAVELQKAGEFTPALDWFRSVYAYNLPLATRKIYYSLELENTEASVV